MGIAAAHLSTKLGRYALIVLCAVLIGSCVIRWADPIVESVPSIQLRSIAFNDLPNWRGDGQLDAVLAFRKSCPILLGGSEIKASGLTVQPREWSDACAAAEVLAERAGPLDQAAVRGFFEKWFQAYSVSADGQTEGLFTGYFEAGLRGSRQRTERFTIPLFGVPKDLVSVDLGQFDPGLDGKRIVAQVADGKIRPYPRRGDIQDGALRDDTSVLAWVDDPIDAFLLHVQGSGRVALAEGDELRVGYAGNNGHGYVSIGRTLIDRGELPAGQAGWREIRNWIERNPTKAGALLAENPRFIFFREISGEGPIGALGVPLTPRRSLAVDPAFIPLGVPLWLDTVWPGGGDRPLRRLMVAQDTGSAIKGPVRGDFFWGYGRDALVEAGRMKSPGRYFLLLPRRATVPVS
jgi:membrane-bound lytic murein transglycosylase A